MKWKKTLILYIHYLKLIQTNQTRFDGRIVFFITILMLHINVHIVENIHMRMFSRTNEHYNVNDSRAKGHTTGTTYINTHMNNNKMASH